MTLSAQARDTVRVDSTRVAREYDLGGITVRVARPALTTGGASAVVVRLDSLGSTPAPSMEDVIRSMPLVVVRRNSRGEAQPAIRGSDERQIGVFLDGVPLTIGWDHRTDMSIIPLTAAQSVRLIRGLSSVLYGPNPPGCLLGIDVARLPALPASLAPPPPGLGALVALAALPVLSTVANAFPSRGYRVPIFFFGLWAVAGLAGGLIYPSIVQSVSVDPNLRDKERPFIQRNITATRFAYGIDGIIETPFPAEESVSRQEILDNSATIDNIRLHDARPLRDTFNEIQAIRPFYLFTDVAVYRYEIHGKRRPGMSPRERWTRTGPVNACSSRTASAPSSRR